MPERSDEELMLAAGHGDRAAFGVIVERHYRTVAQFAQRFLGDIAPEAAEDLAQDVFLKAWKASGGFKPRATVITWLLRIATNTCLNYRRRQRFRRALSLWSESSPEPAERETGRTAGLEERDRADHVRGAIATLPSRQRAAIVLRHYHELSYAEIGSILEISVSAVESLLFRARVGLRATLVPTASEEDSPQVSPKLGAESM